MRTFLYLADPVCDKVQKTETVQFFRVQGNKRSKSSLFLKTCLEIPIFICFIYSVVA